MFYSVFSLALEGTASSTTTDVSYMYACTAIGLVASVSARGPGNAQGCISVPVPPLDETTCLSSKVGLLRSNTAKKVLEICDGTAYVSVTVLVCRNVILKSL